MHYADLPFQYATTVPSAPQNAAPFKTGSQKPKKSVSNINVKPVALPASDLKKSHTDVFFAQSPRFVIKHRQRTLPAPARKERLREGQAGTV